MTAAHENLVAGTGVRVNAVCPGLIQTGLAAPFFSVLSKLATSSRVVRLGTPEGTSVTFLGSCMGS